jgi:hypothetical protein
MNMSDRPYSPVGQMAGLADQIGAVGNKHERFLFSYGPVCGQSAAANATDSFLKVDLLDMNLPPCHKACHVSG